MKKVVSDPSNSKHFKITKHDKPIFMVMMDLRNATTGQLSIVTEYIPEDVYADLATHGTIRTGLSNGHLSLGYESGINVAKIKRELNPNVPHFHVPSFLARVGCEYDEGLLAGCIDYILGFTRQVINSGVQEDPIMGHRNYAMNLKALDKINLVTSARVPVRVAKNAIPTLGNSYKISDIYEKTQKPLSKLIKRAYFMPVKHFEMYVFDDGVAKLQLIPMKDIISARKHAKKIYTNFGGMRNIIKHKNK